MSDSRRRRVAPGLPIVEERHAPDYPWPEPRQRGVVVSSNPADVIVRWDTGYEQHVPKDRIGNGMTDLIRFTGDRT
jgi:hypothetical protein